MTPHKLTSASFFTGIAGFEVGFGDLIDTSVMVEIDPHCQTILARNYPHTPLKGDINDVTGSEIGKVDIFCGGFPCQDTSIAAPNRLGLAGARSGNFVAFARVLDEYLRLADELTPRWVVIENPVGLLSSPGRSREDGIDRRGWDMAATTRGLEDLGYGWAYRVVDGRYLGTPSKRERVILVGHLGGDPGPAWQVLADGGAGGEPLEARTQSLLSGPRTRGGATEDGTLIWRKSARPRASLALGGYETWVPADYSNTLAGSDGGNANRQTHILLQDGRLRTLTFLEWERLLGFPDGWTEGIPDAARYTAIGNAMHTGMARWLGERLHTVHNALPQITAA